MYIIVLFSKADQCLSVWLTGGQTAGKAITRPPTSYIVNLSHTVRFLAPICSSACRAKNWTTCFNFIVVILHIVLTIHFLILYHIHSNIVFISYINVLYHFFFTTRFRSHDHNSSAPVKHLVFKLGNITVTSYFNFGSIDFLIHRVHKN